MARRKRRNSPLVYIIYIIIILIIVSIVKAHFLFIFFILLIYYFLKIMIESGNEPQKTKDTGIKSMTLSLTSPAIELKPEEDPIQKDKYRDVVSALRNLKYPKAEAEEAVNEAQRQGANTLEELIRKSLQTLANRK